MTWLWAPRLKPLPGVVAEVADRLHGHGNARRRGLDLARGGEGVVERDAALDRGEASRADTRRLGGHGPLDGRADRRRGRGRRRHVLDGGGRPRPEGRVETGRDRQAELDEAAGDGIAEVGDRTVGADLDVNVGARGNVRRQRRCEWPAICVGHADPHRALAAVGDPEHDDQDERQEHDEEQALPITGCPHEVHPGDHERLAHDVRPRHGTSARRARARPIAPITAPIASSTAIEGRMSPSAALGDERLSMPRRNQKWGVTWEIDRELDRRLAERNEDPADRGQREGHDRIQAARLLGRAGHARHDHRDAHRGDDGAHDQERDQRR